MHNKGAVCQWHEGIQEEVGGMPNDVKSLAYAKWNCKYHIVLALMDRRKTFFGERQLCEWRAWKSMRRRYVQTMSLCAGEHTAEGIGVVLYGVSEGERQDHM